MDNMCTELETLQLCRCNVHTKVELVLLKDDAVSNNWLKCKRMMGELGSAIDLVNGSIYCSYVKSTSIHPYDTNVSRLHRTHMQKQVSISSVLPPPLAYFISYH